MKSIVIGQFKMFLSGIGTDIVSVNRIKNVIERSPKFIERIFTNGEIEYCNKNEKRKFEHFAGRFAVKEAIMKALGTGWNKGIKWKEIETMNDENGKPFVKLYGETKRMVDSLGITNILISISHCDEYAIAFVILYCKLVE